MVIWLESSDLGGNPMSILHRERELTSLSSTVEVKGVGLLRAMAKVSKTSPAACRQLARAGRHRSQPSVATVVPLLEVHSGGSELLGPIFGRFLTLNPETSKIVVFPTVFLGF